MEELHHIIKLDAIDSTNTYLKELAAEKVLPDLTVVVTKNQSIGRGQMGNSWYSEANKNLTFSFLKKLKGFAPIRQFELNMVVSLAVFKALDEIGIPNIAVKWPNDIMSGDHKLCGILIENILSGNAIKHAIVGVGLNVNQTDFTSLGKVTSLKRLTGHDHNLDDLLKKVLAHIRKQFDLFEKQSYTKLKKDYLQHLYKKDVVSSFRESTGKIFSGIIRGVSDSGRLIVELENGMVEFNFKEVTLLR